MSGQDSIVSCSSTSNGVVSNVSAVGNVNFVSSVSSINDFITVQIKKRSKAKKKRKKCTNKYK